MPRTNANAEHQSTRAIVSGSAGNTELWRHYPRSSNPGRSSFFDSMLHTSAANAQARNEGHADDQRHDARSSNQYHHSLADPEYETRLSPPSRPHIESNFWSDAVVVNTENSWRFFLRMIYEFFLNRNVIACIKRADDQCSRPYSKYSNQPPHRQYSLRMRLERKCHNRVCAEQPISAFLTPSPLARTLVPPNESSSSARSASSSGSVRCSCASVRASWLRRSSFSWRNRSSFTVEQTYHHGRPHKAWTR